jgi:hypothetical protein
MLQKSSLPRQIVWRLRTFGILIFHSSLYFATEQWLMGNQNTGGPQPPDDLAWPGRKKGAVLIATTPFHIPSSL